MEEQYFTPDETATRLKLHVVTIRKLIREGALPGVKLGKRQWRIPESALRDYMTAGPKKQPASAPAAAPTRSKRRRA